MRNIEFEPESLKHYAEWANEDKKTFNKITKLIFETSRQPFKGTGKPEPLKHKLKGCWSRRINQQHRLVYKVDDDIITILACKYHY